MARGRKGWLVLTIPCPKCGAAIGQECSGPKFMIAHKERWWAAPVGPIRSNLFQTKARREHGAWPSFNCQRNRHKACQDYYGRRVLYSCSCSCHREAGK